MDPLIAATVERHLSRCPAMARVVFAGLPSDKLIAAFDEPSTLCGCVAVAAELDKREFLTEDACFARALYRVRISRCEFVEGMLVVEVDELVEGPDWLRPLRDWPLHHVPRCALQAVDPVRIADELRALIVALHPSLKPPRSPTALSFWLASNLPLSLSKRRRLLSLDTVPRLLALAGPVRALGDIMCVSCNTVIGSFRHVIVANDQALSSSYTNPHGFSHDLLVLSELCIEPIVIGQPSPRDTWFAGYAWQICICECRAHLGWRFTRVSDAEPRQRSRLSLLGQLQRMMSTTAQPQEPQQPQQREFFWGLTHRSVAHATRLNVDYVDEQEESDSSSDE